VQYVSIGKTLTLIVEFVIPNEDGIIVERKLFVCSARAPSDGQGGQPFPKQLPGD
jgi:hypothetical protein